MPIPFTQFKRPDGRKVPVTIERPPEVEALAKSIMQAGCRFEIEVLMTGQISMEIVRDVPDPDIYDSIAREICSNGPAVDTAVDKMIRDAAALLETLKDQKQ